MTRWATPAHQMQYPASLSQGGRGSWDYAYLNASTAAGVPPAAQPLQRPDLTADLGQLSAENTYQPYSERTTRV
jgi:hypothetical protein